MNHNDSAAGSHTFQAIALRSLARPLARLERFGLFIIIGVLFLLPWIGGQLGFDLDLLPWVLGVPVEFLLKVVSIVTGNG